MMYNLWIPKTRLIWLPILATVGCEVGLPTTPEKIYDSKLEQTDEPAPNPHEALEPAIEPSMEPATEPSNESETPQQMMMGMATEQMGDCNDADGNIDLTPWKFQAMILIKIMMEWNFATKILILMDLPLKLS